MALAQGNASGLARQRPVQRLVPPTSDSNNNHHTAPSQGRSLHERHRTASVENLDRANSRSEPNLNDAILVPSDQSDSSPNNSNYQQLVIQGIVS